MSVLTPLVRMACIVAPPFQMSDWRVRDERVVSYMLDLSFAKRRAHGLSFCIGTLIICTLLVALDATGVYQSRSRRISGLYFITPVLFAMVVHGSIDFIRAKRFRRIEFLIPPESPALTVRLNGRTLREPSIIVTPVIIKHPVGKAKFEGHAAVLFAKGAKPIVLSASDDQHTIGRDLAAFGLDGFATFRSRPRIELRGICEGQQVRPG